MNEWWWRGMRGSGASLLALGGGSALGGTGLIDAWAVEWPAVGRPTRQPPAREYVVFHRGWFLAPPRHNSARWRDHRG